MKFTARSLLLVCISVLFLAGAVVAVKNMCPKCGKVQELDAINCKYCEEPLNQCLECKTLNPVSEDYCTNCFENLAEMRVLASIDPETRESLKLGESERAQLDRELQKLNFMLENDPDKREKILFRRGKIYHRMGFSAREVSEWESYLQEFPQTPKKAIIVTYLSEALRKTGYLFYSQGNKNKAFGLFKQATEANPVNPEAWSWYARMLSERKDYKAAGDAYLEALKARPGDRTFIHFLKGLKRPIPKELLSAPTAAPTSKPAKND